MSTAKHPKAPENHNDTPVDVVKLVQFLHHLALVARQAHDEYAAEMIADAAVALDEYRAGLRVVAPHPSTGYALQRIGGTQP